MKARSARPPVIDQIAEPLIFQRLIFAQRIDAQGEHQAVPHFEQASARRGCRARPESAGAETRPGNAAARETRLWRMLLPAATRVTRPLGRL